MGHLVEDAGNRTIAVGKIGGLELARSVGARYAVLTVRISEEEMENYKKAAAKSGNGLSHWVRKYLNQAACRRIDEVEPTLTQQEYLSEKKRLADNLVKSGVPRNLVDNCVRSIEQQSRESE